MTEEVKVNYVDHISIAVKDLTKAEEDFKKMFGWKVAGRHNNLDENIRVIYFQVGQTAVELMEDMDGTGEVAKFIERRGEGVMILSFNVDNCMDSLGILKNNGAQVIDKEPRLAKELNRYFAFIHPKACHVPIGSYRGEILETISKMPNRPVSASGLNRKIQGFKDPRGQGVE